MIKNSCNSEIIIKPCTAAQLAASYGVSTKVLRHWLQVYPQLHYKKNRGYNLQQLLFIIDKIGLPCLILKD
ncbi:MAG TPA: hypothetical protein PL045_01320 [Chitinophagaceae bacterium]|nr:hypothetical protein [Chitinophagaceae bacterium]